MLMWFRFGICDLLAGNFTVLAWTGTERDETLTIPGEITVSLFCSIAAALLEGHAFGDGEDEALEGVVLFGHAREDGVDGGAVVRFGAAAERIREHLFHDVAQIGVFAVGEEDV